MLVLPSEREITTAYQVILDNLARRLQATVEEGVVSQAEAGSLLQ